MQDDSKPHQESQSQVSYESTIEAGTDFPCALNRDALVALQQNAPYLGGEPLPLTRYQHDIQAYEQLALGIRADEYEPNPDPETSSLRPVAANGVPKDGQPSIGSAVSSLYLSPSPGRISSSGPFQSVAPEASLSSEQLHKLYGVVETSEWDDDMSPEERLEHFRRAYVCPPSNPFPLSYLMPVKGELRRLRTWLTCLHLSTRLRRRVRSETRPRALRSSKVRKRDRHHLHNKKDHSSSS